MITLRRFFSARLMSLATFRRHATLTLIITLLSFAAFFAAVLRYIRLRHAFRRLRLSRFAALFASFRHTPALFRRFTLSSSFFDLRRAAATIFMLMLFASLIDALLLRVYRE